MVNLFDGNIFFSNETIISLIFILLYPLYVYIEKRIEYLSIKSGKKFKNIIFCLTSNFFFFFLLIFHYFLLIHYTFVNVNIRNKCQYLSY